MTKQDAELLVDQVIAQLPDNIADALDDVTVYTVAGRQDPELKAAIRNAGMAKALIREDFRGLFLGTTARIQDDDATSGAPLPQGSIVLNADALESLGDVRDTLAHEMGHALGMSEEEVENLGLG